MEWRLILIFPRFKIRTISYGEDREEFISREGGMVERCASTFVFIIDTDPLLEEVDEGEWLVPLRCHMDHIHSASVLSANICPVFDQQPDQMQVAVERCEVKRCKGVFAIGLLVNPSA